MFVSGDRVFFDIQYARTSLAHLHTEHNDQMTGEGNFSTPWTGIFHGMIAWACIMFYAHVVNAQSLASELRIGYLKLQTKPKLALSNLDPIPENLGLDGLRLAIADNNTTGQFTGQKFSLKEIIVPADGNPVDAFNSLAANHYQIIVTSLPATIISQIEPVAQQKNILVFDTLTRDDGLRVALCGSNILHLMPSRAMRADALAQYLFKKNWRDWFLVVGPNPSDRLYASALKRAAKRYGMTIVAERPWKFTHDARRTAQSEVPVFTQGVDYDMLVVADEAGLFGEYLAYRTWKPRPIAGSQGLVPTAWHKTHEQWGAVQLQNRFKAKIGRSMAEEDYAAWLAGRAIGEAATRTGSTSVDKISAYVTGNEFALAGFKGKKLSFRKWNGQLRQPVLLAGPRSMVAVAPVEGFLHPTNALDSLGFDQPETNCKD